MFEEGNYVSEKSFINNLPIALKTDLTYIDTAWWKSSNMFEETIWKYREYSYVKDSFLCILCILSIKYSCEFYHVVIGKKTTMHILKSENQLCCAIESHRILEGKQVHKEYIWLKNKKYLLTTYLTLLPYSCLCKWNALITPVRKANKKNMTVYFSCLVQYCKNMA